MISSITNNISDSICQVVILFVKYSNLIKTIGIQLYGLK